MLDEMNEREQENEEKKQSESEPNRFGYDQNYGRPEETHYGYYSGGSFSRSQNTNNQGYANNQNTPNNMNVQGGYGYSNGGYQNYNSPNGNMQNGNFDSRYNGSYDHRTEKKSGTGKKVALAIFLIILLAGISISGYFGIKSIYDYVYNQVSNEFNQPGNGMADLFGGSEETVPEETPVVPVAPKEPEIAQSAELAPIVSTVVTDVTQVVDKVMPCVVQVTNTGVITQNFFGQQFQQESKSAGSGIIVKETANELLIVTNYHVISDAESLTITFTDDEQAEANIKGYDSDKDLAVVAIPLENIKASTKKAIAIAELGDSDSLKVGEPAIAIGNALGYGQSVTVGVISAKNRQMDMGNTDFELIQTDAAINPGNSGGALVNIKGQVIGINSNKLGGNAIEGMGYAIPISEARPIIDGLMSKETKTKVEEGQESYIGISGIDVDEQVSKTYGIPKGIYIEQIFPNTGASRAGLQVGDIITKFDDEGLSSMTELQKKLTFYPAGTTVNITVLRGAGTEYKEYTIPITLSNRNEMDK